MHPVLLAMTAMLALSLLPATLQAGCAAEIAALFRGGPLDPFERPNRRETVTTINPDGSESPYSEVVWDGPTRAINCFPGSCVLMVETRLWTGPDFDGPWTPSPMTTAYDPAQQARAIADDMAANITEAECGVRAEIAGEPAMVYRYRTRTNPDASQSWFGGHYTAFIGEDTGQLVRLEEAESVTNWAPSPVPGIRVTTIVYDPGIRITQPAD